MPDPCTAGAQADAAATFELDGRRLCVLCVDDVLPRMEPSAMRSGRARMRYARGELAHFELGGHRYAVVECEPIDGATPRAEPGGLGIHELLTNRELQIVQLICMGCLTKQVADRLQLSEFTVRSYLKTVYAKLGVRSRGAMVYRYAQAVRRGGGSP